MRCAAGTGGIDTSRWRFWRMRIWWWSAAKRTGKKGRVDVWLALVPLTVPEVRRLLWQVVWAQAPDVRAALAWSDWRRRHQQRARFCHWITRTTRALTRL